MNLGIKKKYIILGIGFVLVVLLALWDSHRYKPSDFILDRKRFFEALKSEYENEAIEQIENVVAASITPPFDTDYLKKELNKTHGYKNRYIGTYDCRDKFYIHLDMDPAFNREYPITEETVLRVVDVYKQAGDCIHAVRENNKHLFRQGYYIVHLVSPRKTVYVTEEIIVEINCETEHYYVTRDNSFGEDKLYFSDRQGRRFYYDFKNGKVTIRDLQPDNSAKSVEKPKTGTYSFKSNKEKKKKYDEGYNDVYINETYDEDRYETDEQYARGVDDAIDEDDGNW